MRCINGFINISIKINSNSTYMDHRIGQIGVCKPFDIFSIVLADPDVGAASVVVVVELSQLHKGCMMLSEDFWSISLIQINPLFLWTDVPTDDWTDQRTDIQTNQPTDRQTLIYRCVVASKKG